MSAELKKSIIDWAILLSFLVVGYGAWKLTPDWTNTQAGEEPEVQRTSDRGESRLRRPIVETREYE